MGQQAAKGAADAGASGIRAPSAEASHQVNILPRNTRSSQVVPQTVLRHDANGVPGLSQPAGHVQPMPANDKPVVEGPLSKRAGDRSGPSVANQGAEQKSPPGLDRARQLANNAQEGYPRANAGRYGAVGGVAVSLASDAVDALRGRPVDLAGSAERAGTNAAVGYGAARASSALAPAIGMRMGGAAVAGAIEGAVSTTGNTQAYRRGEITAARASANIAVDTGTAAVAGAAGIVAGGWAGAAVGSAAGTMALPVVGTAAGAIAGFGVGLVVGTGAYVTVRGVAQVTGAMDAAKDKLADVLVRHEKPLGNALETVGRGLDAVNGAAGKAWNAVKFW